MIDRIGYPNTVVLIVLLTASLVCGTNFAIKYHAIGDKVAFTSGKMIWIPVNAEDDAQYSELIRQIGPLRFWYEWMVICCGVLCCQLVVIGARIRATRMNRRSG